MNIKQVEELTCITRQNIRFYEKQGLIHPVRNPDNDYREYRPEDIRALKVIRLLRKLNMPVDTIRQVLAQETSLPEALSSHLQTLHSEREQLDAAIAFCQEIQSESLEALDVDAQLSKLGQQESAGHVFHDFLHDFKAVVIAEENRRFCFSPDTMVRTPAEFTEALLQYAGDHNLNLVLTREGMYPEFRIDDVEYVAHRYYTCFGAVITCMLKHPENYEPAGVSQRRRKLFRFLWVSLWVSLLPIIILILLAANSLRDGGSFAVILPFALILAAALAGIYYFFPKIR